MSVLNVICIGDVRGKWKMVLKKLNSACSKKTFDFALCVGDTFQDKTNSRLGSKDDEECWQNIKNGRIKLPLSLYVLGSDYECDANNTTGGKEFNENLFFLGTEGIYYTTGISIAYFSEVKEELGYDRCLGLLKQANSETDSFLGVDILLTSEWPKGVLTHVFPQKHDYHKFGSDEIMQLATKLEPQYHFAGKHSEHFERPPYKNISERNTTTRFIALSNVANPEKKKWMYAFTIIPRSNQTVSKFSSIPNDVTELPFIQILKKTAFRGVQSDIPVHQSRKRFKSVQSPQQCWFCLGGSDVQKNLIVSVGKHSYLAIAKGGLSEEHVLIIPIGHFQNTLDLPPEAAEEIRTYRKILLEVAKHSHDVQNVMFYERNYRANHMQIQAIFVPHRISTWNDSVQSISKTHHVNLQRMQANCPVEELLPPGKPYFCFEFGHDHVFICEIGDNFPLHFGREIFASILGCSDKIDWKMCQNEKEIETKWTKQFRQKIAPFDIFQKG